MASLVEVCNMALANIGKTSIADLSEGSAEALACSQFLQHSIDTLLRRYPWLFARKVEALALLVSNDRALVWSYAYQRPADCLHELRLLDETKADPVDYQPGEIILQGGHAYELAGTTIYCHVEKAHLLYTRKTTDVTGADAAFIDALAWSLASRIAMPLTRDPAIRNDALQIAEREFLRASADDANRKRRTHDYMASWHEARL